MDEIPAGRSDGCGTQSAVESTADDDERREAVNEFESRMGPRLELDYAVGRMAPWSGVPEASGVPVRCYPWEPRVFSRCAVAFRGFGSSAL